MKRMRGSFYVTGRRVTPETGVVGGGSSVLLAVFIHVVRCSADYVGSGRDEFARQGVCNEVRRAITYKATK